MRKALPRPLRRLRRGAVRRPRRARRLAHGLAALGVVALCAAAVAAPAGAARRSVPSDFLGMTFDGPLFSPDVDSGYQMGLMAADGVEVMRVSVDWAQAQPYGNWKDVPAQDHARFTNVGGVPTDFHFLDGLVKTAGAHGMRLLPVVEHAPRWARQYPDVQFSPPRINGSYTRFLAALVRRYGSNGSIHPRRPIYQWVIWNEPEDYYFWANDKGQPAGLARYVSLLHASYGTVHHLDRHALVDLAGLNSRGPRYPSWGSLDRLYQLGARGSFDIVDIHPYSLRYRDVIRELQYGRNVMNRHGDRRKRMIVGEFGWPTARYRNGRSKTSTDYRFDVSEAGQASRVRLIMPELARQRGRLGLRAVYMYSWMSYDRSHKAPFDYAGLRAYVKPDQARSKPALFSWTRAARQLEGCVKTTAGRCR